MIFKLSYLLFLWNFIYRASGLIYRLLTTKTHLDHLLNSDRFTNFTSQKENLFLRLKVNKQQKKFKFKFIKLSLIAFDKKKSSLFLIIFDSEFPKKITKFMHY